MCIYMNVYVYIYSFQLVITTPRKILIRYGIASVYIYDEMYIFIFMCMCI